MTIQIKIKTVYGVDRIYPVNETAIKFTQLLETKTLTRAHLQIIEAMGYKIEQVHAYALTGDAK